MSVSETQQRKREKIESIKTSFALKEIRKIGCHPTETFSGVRNGT